MFWEVCGRRSNFLYLLWAKHFILNVSFNFYTNPKWGEYNSPNCTKEKAEAWNSLKSGPKFQEWWSQNPSLWNIWLGGGHYKQTWDSGEKDWVELETCIWDTDKHLGVDISHQMKGNFQVSWAMPGNKLESAEFDLPLTIYLYMHW